MKNKKRFTITMSESVYDYLEKVCKEKGLSKSAMLTVVLEEYKKGQKWTEKKRPPARVRFLDFLYFC